MRIGVDLDDVLVEFVQSLINFLNKKYGFSLKFDDIKYYDLWRCGLGKNPEQSASFIREFYYSDEFDCIPLIKGVKHALEKLSDFHDFMIITSRAGCSREKTEKFLQTHFPGIPVFYSAGYGNPGKTKSEICKEERVDIFVEDCLNYAVGCSDFCQVLLYDKPWNREYCDNGIIRVYNWKDILQKIKEIEYARASG